MLAFPKNAFLKSFTFSQYMCFQRWSAKEVCFYTLPHIACVIKIKLIEKKSTFQGRFQASSFIFPSSTVAANSLISKSNYGLGFNMALELIRNFNQV